MLPTLTIEEELLLQRIEEVQGQFPFDQRAARLREQGVLAAYDTVYHAYVAHGSDDSDELEALKRALFLQWIGFVEPTELTGIGELDRGTQYGVLVEIQHRVTRNQADTELVWMLRWYDSITDYYFTNLEGPTWYFFDFGDLPGLRLFLAEKHGDIKLATIFTEDSLQRRGQMGAYWLNMLHGQENHHS